MGDCLQTTHPEIAIGTGLPTGPNAYLGGCLHRRRPKKTPYGAPNNSNASNPPFPPSPSSVVLTVTITC